MLIPLNTTCYRPEKPTACTAQKEPLTHAVNLQRHCFLLLLLLRQPMKSNVNPHLTVAVAVAVETEMLHWITPHHRCQQNKNRFHSGLCPRSVESPLDHAASALTVRPLPLNSRSQSSPQPPLANTHLINTLHLHLRLHQHLQF